MKLKDLQAENERLKQALRVIHTWASFDLEHSNLPMPSLSPVDVKHLCHKALKGKDK